jgi:hypothetical protein
MLVASIKPSSEIVWLLITFLLSRPGPVGDEPNMHSLLIEVTVAAGANSNRRPRPIIVQLRHDYPDWKRTMRATPILCLMA